MTKLFSLFTYSIGTCFGKQLDTVCVLSWLVSPSRVTSQPCKIGFMRPHLGFECDRKFRKSSSSPLNTVEYRQGSTLGTPSLLMILYNSCSLSAFSRHSINDWDIIFETVKRKNQCRYKIVRYKLTLSNAPKSLGS